MMKSALKTSLKKPGLLWSMNEMASILAKSHFDQSSKIKGIENLLEDLKRLL